MTEVLSNYVRKYSFSKPMKLWQEVREKERVRNRNLNKCRIIWLDRCAVLYPYLKLLSLKTNINSSCVVDFI